MPEACSGEPETNAGHVTDVPVVEARQPDPVHAEDVVGGRQEEDVVLEVTQTSSEVAAAAASSEVKRRGGAGALTVAARPAHPRYTVEHPSEAGAGGSSRSARRVADRMATERGWTRQGIPAQFVKNAVAEQEAWGTQQSCGSELQDLLERALALHKDVGAPLHRVSDLPQLALYTCYHSFHSVTTFWVCPL